MVMTFNLRLIMKGGTLGKRSGERMVKPGCNTVLLGTSAVKVINPGTGKATLAHAQHDTASQATLISKSLRNELGSPLTPIKSLLFVR